MKKRAVIQKKNCVACGCCVKVCPRSAISVPLGIHAEIDYGLCVGCGKCVKLLWNLAGIRYYVNCRPCFGAAFFCKAIFYGLPT